MKDNFTQTEILLIVNTSFFSRSWAIKNKAKDDKLTRRERLKEACWNGLAPEMLPECFEQAYDKSNTLWEINDANAFIDLDFSNYMHGKDIHYSINPYAFMQVQAYN